MVKIMNESYVEFKKHALDRKVILWGAGETAKYALMVTCKDMDVIYIIDNNSKLWGKEYVIENGKYPIIGLDQFLDVTSVEERKNMLIYISSKFYAGDIISQLNEVEELNGMPCYIRFLMDKSCDKQEFSFTKGEPKIPKKIHYCWFGGKEIPKKLQVYMDSWKKFCPDYEIIRWDERNYDISKCQYMREAYECKKWGFVPDYARLDIIYNEGGIYLDVDVELVDSLDKLRNDDMFFGMMGFNESAFGLGFGAIKGHPLIKKLRDYYMHISFYKEDGKMDLRACSVHQDPILRDYGFLIENHYERKNGIVAYPSEVLYSVNSEDEQKNITEKTVSIHHCEISWASEQQKRAYLKTLLLLNVIYGER